MRTVLRLIVLAAIGAFLYGVWPTPYKITVKDGTTYRQNCFTSVWQRQKKTGEWVSTLPIENFSPDSRLKDAGVVDDKSKS